MTRSNRAGMPPGQPASHVRAVPRQSRLLPWVVAGATVPAVGGTEPPLPEPEPAEAVPPVVTEADDGATFRTRPGDETALRLSSDWTWGLPESRGTSLTLTQVDYFADPAFVEWHVEAVAAGTAEVGFQGTPDCDDEAACPPRRVTFRFVVEN